MTRRIKRFKEFDIALAIKEPGFISPHRDYQQNWLLNRTMNEFCHDIYALHSIAKRFVPGSVMHGLEDRTQAELTDHEIMEDWQIPIMDAMAKVVTQSSGNVLEIGFGRGVGSGLIQKYGTKRHDIIECNDSIVARFTRWKQQFVDSKIAIHHGLWQSVLPKLGLFDGIFFHTYPLKESEFVDQIANSTTFAEHFFPHAAEHLKKGGVFTYLSNEIDSLSRNHQRLLFKYFDSVELKVIRDLPIPTDVKDQWWADSMVLVKAVK